VPVKIDFKFKKILDALVDGDLYNFCYQCGACVGDCPAAKYNPEFNPRLIMLEARLGLGEKLCKADSIIWKCTNCYACYERCPQDVKPVEVITALKNIAVQQGNGPKELTSLLEKLRETGRPVQVTEAVKRNRKKYGLNEIPDVPVEEIQELLR
jgi:heterodisulfide reductase subunit C